MDAKQVDMQSDIDKHQLNKAFITVKIDQYGSTQTLVDNQQLEALYKAALAYAEQVRMKELLESHEAYLQGERKGSPWEEVKVRILNKLHK